MSLRERRQVSAWWLLFALALAAGIFLRWYQLSTQILLDDEWHAIHKLLNSDARNIATHLGVADYSIPLTLYFQFLYLHGGLSEWGMRIPMLLSGIGLLAIAPRMLRSLAPLSVRVSWVALMAISPMMIYHTRTTRPYAITTLLVFAAIMAFWEWWRASERRWPAAILYVACTFLAGWLHLITLPFSMLPIAFFGCVTIGEIVRPSTRAVGLHNLGRLVLIGLAVSLPLTGAVAPPMINDFASLAAKAGTDAVTFDSAYRSLLICFGTGSPWLLAVLVFVFAIGTRSFWQRERDFVAYLSFIVLIGMAAVAASKPAWVQHPLTYARYIQPVVPFFLLAVAEGAVVLIRRIPTDPIQAALIGAACCALYIAGPIPAYLYNPNQFMGDPYFQFDYDPAYNPYLTLLPQGPIPAFYQQLAKLPPRSLTLIETPWSLETPSDPQPLYQKVHRQMIKIAFNTPTCGVHAYGNIPATSSGMQLNEFVHLSTLLQGDTAGADFLVVHLRSWPNPAHPPSEWPDIGTCLPQIEKHFGAPVFRDADIEAFALTPAARAAMQ